MSRFHVVVVVVVVVDVVIVVVVVVVDNRVCRGQTVGLTGAIASDHAQSSVNARKKAHIKFYLPFVVIVVVDVIALSKKMCYSFSFSKPSQTKLTEKSQFTLSFQDVEDDTFANCWGRSCPAAVLPPNF